MIKISVANAPSGAAYWSASLHPSEVYSGFIPLANAWEPAVDIPSGGNSLNVYAYPATQDLILAEAVAIGPVQNGYTYVFDFASGILTQKAAVPWKWIGVGIGVTALALIVASSSKR